MHNCRLFVSLARKRFLMNDIMMAENAADGAAHAAIFFLENKYAWCG
jgi:hypothetical protein